MRDCHEVFALVACSTQPIIESSDGIRFGPFPFAYTALARALCTFTRIYSKRLLNLFYFLWVVSFVNAEQIDAAGLSPFNCNWENIHDFSPDSVVKNYSLILNVSLFIETKFAIAFTFAGFVQYNICTFLLKLLSFII